MKIISSVVTLFFLIMSGCSHAPSISREEIPASAPPKVKEHIEKLYSADKTIRVSALNALGETGEDAKDAVPFIIGMLDDNETVEFIKPSGKSEWYCGFCISTCIRINTCLEYPWTYYRKRKVVALYAVKALGDIGDKRALKPVVRKIDSYNYFMTLYAFEALEKIGVDESITDELFEKYDSDSSARARKLLIEIKSPRIIEKFIGMLDPDDMRMNKKYLKERERIKEKYLKTSGALYVEKLSELKSLKYNHETHLVVMALREMTGMEFDYDYQSWLSWWEKNKNKYPKELK